MEIFNPFAVFQAIEKVIIESDSEKVIVTFTLREPINNISKIVVYVYSTTPIETKNTLKEAFRFIYGGE